MKTAIVWILLAMSEGGGNFGTVTNIGTFPTPEACEAVRTAAADIIKQALDGRGWRGVPHGQLRCVKAEVVSQ